MGERGRTLVRSRQAIAVVILVLVTVAIRLNSCNILCSVVNMIDIRRPLLRTPLTATQTTDTISSLSQSVNFHFKWSTLLNFNANAITNMTATTYLAFVYSLSTDREIALQSANFCFCCLPLKLVLSQRRRH